MLTPFRTLQGKEVWTVETGTLENSLVVAVPLRDLGSKSMESISS